MYTTLDFLKANEACKDGYRQMISFFGMSAKMKETKLPLSLCSLVLSKTNLNWLVLNALIVEPEQFEKYYERWAAPLNLATMWNSCPTKTNAAYDAYMAYASAATFEQFKAAHDVHKNRSYAAFDKHRESHWNDPIAFIAQTIEHNERSATSRHEQLWRTIKSIAPPPKGTYFDVKHVSYLFSDDPYGEAISFIAENQEKLPLTKARLKLDSTGPKPKGIFEVTTSEAVYNTYRFLSMKNTAAALARSLEDDEEDESVTTEDDFQEAD